jgi:hypothetical protein
VAGNDDDDERATDGTRKHAESTPSNVQL